MNFKKCKKDICGKVLRQENRRRKLHNYNIKKGFLKVKHFLKHVPKYFPTTCKGKNHCNWAKKNFHQFQADYGSFLSQIFLRKNLTHGLSFIAEARKCIWESYLELYQEQAPSSSLSGESKHFLVLKHLMHIIHYRPVMAPWDTHSSLSINHSGSSW